MSEAKARERFKQVVRNTGMNYSEFAREIGVSSQHVTNIMNDRKTPSGKIAYKVQKSFGVSCVWVMDGIKPKHICKKHTDESSGHRDALLRIEAAYRKYHVGDWHIVDYRGYDGRNMVASELTQSVGDVGRAALDGTEDMMIEAVAQLGAVAIAAMQSLLQDQEGTDDE